MKNKIIITILSLLFIITGGIVYLNNVFLPKKIKALIIRGIEEKTNVKVSLDSVKVNIFKGLVLENLSLYDDHTVILRVKEASCIFIPWELIQKKIVIPNINLKSAQLFVERRKDGTLNLQELLFKRILKEEKPTAPSGASTAEKKGLEVFVYRVNLLRSNIIFQDDTFEKPFLKSIDNLNITVYLSLPASVKFRMNGQILSKPILNLSASGEYRLSKQELDAKIILQNFALKDFYPYYQIAGFKVNSGLINMITLLKVKDNRIYSDNQLQGSNVNFTAGEFNIGLNAAIKALVEYGITDKQVKFSGSAQTADSYFDGFDITGKISGINGLIMFNNKEAFANNLTANIMGIPVQAKVKLTDFSAPVLDINAASNFDLTPLQKILEDRLKFKIPGSLSGSGRLSLLINNKFSQADSLVLSGFLDLNNGILKFDKFLAPIEGISGRLAFTKDQLQWRDFNLIYQGIPYKTSGSMEGFKSPAFDFSLSSVETNLSAKFSIVDKVVRILNLYGHYLSSDFSAKGNIDLSSGKNIWVDLGGSLFVDLNDLRKVLVKFKDKLDKINPTGKVHAQFSISGDINDIKNCTIEGKLTSEEIMAYGLKGEGLFLNYEQDDGICNVPFAQLSLYDGSLKSSFNFNLKKEGLPYSFNFTADNVKIEKLKMDTPASDKDISGIIQGEFKSSGSLKDIVSSKGSGTIIISKGKLWELNLFKGLGKLLFSQDFSNIIFYEGTCAFTLEDKYVSTKNLILKSNMVNLAGPVSIGFDNSIEASLNIDIISDFVPLTGTLKDVTTVLIGKAERFAVIRITGTLKEPKYKLEPAVMDILRGLTNAIFRKE